MKIKMRLIIAPVITKTDYCLADNIPIALRPCEHESNILINYQPKIQMI
jgi:hypothetical protein